MANYVVSDGNLSAVADAIRAKGGTSAPLAFPAGFVSAVNAIPTGGGGSSVSPSDVNFLDYDGTIVHSYTAAEFAALSALPENPTHDGLTAQGWNWSLADAKAYVAKYGKLFIGQMYITDDGKTRIYIHLEEGRLSPYLGVCPCGTVDIDWGDGSAHDTVTGTSVTTVVNTQHTYATAGDYVIALTVTGSMGLVGKSAYGSQVLSKNGTNNLNRVYQNAIQKVEIGSGVTSIEQYTFSFCCSLTSITIPDSVTTIGQYAFQQCYSLTSITIPNSVTAIAGYTFIYCYSLTSIIIPDGVTGIGSYMFQYCNSLVSVIIPESVETLWQGSFSGCYSLTSIIIPDGVTSIGRDVFQNCYSLTSITIPDGVTMIGINVLSECRSLTSITIPNSVTTIASNALNNCYGLSFVKFEGSTPPTVSSSNAWTNIPTDCVIYVPAGSLSAYTSATNYPSSSTYTYVEY